MADVFISYASEDRERVRILANSLEISGFSVWWDRKIVAGQSFDTAIEKELETSKSVVVLWSKDSIGSEWVKNEAAAGAERGVLVPALIDNVRIPLEFRRKQTVDLVSWEGDTSHPGFQALCEGIAGIITAGTQTAESQTEPTTKAAESIIVQEPEPIRVTKKGRWPLIGASLGVSLVLLIVGWWFFYSRQPSFSPPPPELKTFTNSIGMMFELIPAGTFQMGSPSNESNRLDDETLHNVTISKPFYLQTTEVTQGQWQKVMGNNPSKFNNCGEVCPVENISWFDAQEFIKKLNLMEKSDKYRLPTEAEWEYACRAGGTGRFCFGDDEGKLKDYAWYDNNSSGKTHPVGQKQPNAWGLYDMHGNVWEWCQDWYELNADRSVIDPRGPDSGERRVLRGGSWSRSIKHLRSAYRDSKSPDSRSDIIGLRVARTY